MPPGTLSPPAPASSACDLDFSAPDRRWVPTPRREPLLSCAPARAAPTTGRAYPAARESARPFRLAAAPSSPLPGGAAAQCRPGCGKQQQLAAATSPAGSPPRPGACAEPCLARRTAHLYPAPGHPPLPPTSPPGEIRARSHALEGLDIPASQAAASTGGVSASRSPRLRAPLPPRQSLGSQRRLPAAGTWVA